MFIKNLLMTGFELPTSDGGNNHSDNWATTTAQQLIHFVNHVDLLSSLSNRTGESRQKVWVDITSNIFRWRFCKTHMTRVQTKVFLGFLFFLKPHFHPNGFYWGNQCSRTLTPANSMQVSIMQYHLPLPTIFFSISTLAGQVDASRRWAWAAEECIGREESGNLRIRSR